MKFCVFGVGQLLIQLTMAIIGKNMEMTKKACEMTIKPRNNDATGSTE